MAQVHVDFADLQNFQQVLRESSEQFTDIDQRTKNTLNSYEWKDAVAEKFRSDFEEGMKPILELKKKMEDFQPWLQKRINALMSYHGM